MRLERLEVSCFRNLRTVAVDLNPRLNLFYGANGAGKTALLEAVHMLARGRSFRTQRARTLIRQGSQALIVRGDVRDEFRGRQRIAMRKDLAGRTELTINGAAERRLSEAARLMPIQLMLPDIAELVFGGPQQRRQWLDWGMFHVEPGYLGALRSYLQVVKQRNAALKSGAELDVWTRQLCEAAVQVDSQRRGYLGKLAPVFEAVLSRLAPELSVALVYCRGWPDDQPLDKVLGEWASREVKLGATQAGPHRADVDLRVGESRASAVLSRGQAKVVASALKLSQARFLATSAQRDSVFLIDDVGAELDESHNSRFFEVLEDSGSQMLATSVRPWPRDGRFGAGLMSMFHVEHGVVTGD